MLQTTRNPFRSFWETKFETPFALNLFVCIITYAILFVYCILCLHNVDTMFLDTAGKVNEAKKLEYIAQFYVDAFFPSTLTLVISIIIQNMIEGFKNREVRWSFTAVAVMFTVIYSMVCSSLRTSLSVWLFILFTFVLVVLCFISIVQIQQSSQDSIGISGEV